MYFFTNIYHIYPPFQKLVKAIETLTQAYDDFVCSNNDLGLDNRGHNVHAVEQGNVRNILIQTSG